MDYYDELGVSRSATPDEIRRAYRTLVRLLHPDRQQDEQLRRAAERQLQRITAIVAILTREARGKTAAPPFPTPATCVWLGAAACGVLGIALLLTTQGASNASSPTAPTPATVAPPAPSSPPPPRATRPLRAKSSSEPQPIEDPPAWTITETTPTPAAPPPPELAAPPKGNSPDPGSSRATTTPGTDLYAPEHIEVALLEQGREVRGDYRARYAIGNKPLSPSIAFTFEGMAQEAKLRWAAPSGALGQIHLKLQKDGTLQVNWWATRLSSLSSSQPPASCCPPSWPEVDQRGQSNPVCSGACTQLLARSADSFWILRMASAIWSMSRLVPSSIVWVNQIASSHSRSFSGQ